MDTQAFLERRSRVSLDGWCRSCYSNCVFGRLTIGLLLLMALFLAPLRAATPVCALSQPVVSSASCAACCAAMKSCILPKQNPTNAVTTTSADPFVFATIAPIAVVSLSDSLAKHAPYPAAQNPRAGYAHSHRAVLCTFLI